MKTYTTTDIARLGIKRERLKGWMKRYGIKPSIAESTGAGVANLFSKEDVCRLLVLKTLIEHGWNTNRLWKRVCKDVDLDMVNTGTVVMFTKVDDAILVLDLNSIREKAQSF